MSNHRAKPDHSRRGGVAIFLAITLTMLIGFSALGTEIVYLLYKQRQMQATASAAAFAGAVALMTGYPVAPATEAKAVATNAGFTNGANNVTVTVNNPPATGPNSSLSTAVEVIITQPQILPLSALFYAGSWVVSGRAVATAGNAANYCVLELNRAAAGAVSLTNGASLKLTSCGIAVNSTASPALTVSGATINATWVSVSGTISGSANITSTNPIKTLQPAVANPYASVAVPTYSGCTYTSVYENGGTNPTANPGTYCGSGLTMGGGGTVKMNPGTYIINGGSFGVQGGVTLTGTNVTVVLTGSGSTYATVTISNGANVTLTAPTSGALKGLVFFGDPAAPASNTNSFTGGANMILTGAVYFPSESVTYQNGTSTTSTCTQLIAWQMSFTGGSSFNNSCSLTGITAAGGSSSELVE
jgi:hypothetical protein